MLLDRGVDVQAVEVVSCPNLYLPAERVLRVPTSSSLHAEAMLAGVLLFCYPRSLGLVEQYVSRFVCFGAPDRVVIIVSKLKYERHRECLEAHSQILSKPETYSYVFCF